MPRAAAKTAAPKVRRSRRALDEMVDSFGFSAASIDVMQKAFPTQKLKLLVRGFAKFLLAAESREEVRWSKVDTVVIEHEYGSKVIVKRIKTVSFNLPGSVYTPDFFYILEDGTRIYVEVKASKFQPNYRDARAKLRAAATLNWDVKFAEVMPNKECFNGWSVEHIEPDEEYENVFRELSDVVKGSDGSQQALMEG